MIGQITQNRTSERSSVHELWGSKRSVNNNACLFFQPPYIKDDPHYYIGIYNTYSLPDMNAEGDW